jgi:hypothetical protein
MSIRFYTTGLIVVAAVASLKISVDDVYRNLTEVSSLKVNFPTEQIHVAQVSSEVRVYRQIVPREPDTRHLWGDPKNQISGTIVPSSNALPNNLISMSPTVPPVTYTVAPENSSVTPSVSNPEIRQ